MYLIHFTEILIATASVAGLNPLSCLVGNGMCCGFYDILLILVSRYYQTHGHLLGNPRMLPISEEYPHPFDSSLLMESTRFQVIYSFYDLRHQV